MFVFAIIAAASADVSHLSPYNYPAPAQSFSAAPSAPIFEEQQSLPIASAPSFSAPSFSAPAQSFDAAPSQSFAAAPAATESFAAPAEAASAGNGFRMLNEFLYSISVLQTCCDSIYFNSKCSFNI